MPDDPSWALGYPLDQLRDLAAIYRRHESAYILGAFGATREVQIAELLAAGELLVAPGGGALAAATIRNHRQAVRDFTGEIRAWQQPGDLILSRLAGSGHDLADLILGLESERHIWIESWAEHPASQELALILGARRIATKVRASSELIGLWLIGEADGRLAEPLAVVDYATLVQLPIEIEPRVLQAARDEIERVVPSWADHYSSYNAHHAWSAVALQGYRDPASDQPPELQIEKPAEMARAWQRQHSGWESWPLLATPLAARLPATMALLEVLRWEGRIEIEPQRVRLMRLAPGGGELTRHADITDREAGTADGHVARIHIPIETNPGVVFRQWRLDGAWIEAHMALRSAWYLDTRKPHRAGNHGAEPRVHLVSDLYSGPRLRELIEQGEQPA